MVTPEAFRIATNRTQMFKLAFKRITQLALMKVWQGLQTASALSSNRQTLCRLGCGGVLIMNTSDEFERAIASISAKLKYFEGISDDLAKTVDTNGQTVGSSCNFHELYGIYTSILPKNELQLIHKDSLEVLLSLGPRDSVFRLEGRIEHSSVKYMLKDSIMKL
jgi:hypothetical protein